MPLFYLIFGLTDYAFTKSFVLAITAIPATDKPKPATTAAVVEKSTPVGAKAPLDEGTFFFPS